jgi:hypothetical protein
MDSISPNKLITHVTRHPIVGGRRDRLTCRTVRGGLYVSCQSADAGFTDQVGLVVSGRLKGIMHRCRFRATFSFFGQPACTSDVCGESAWTASRRSVRPSGC